MNLGWSLILTIDSACFGRTYLTQPWSVIPLDPPVLNVWLLRDSIELCTSNWWWGAPAHPKVRDKQEKFDKTRAFEIFGRARILAALESSLVEEPSRAEQRCVG